MKFEGYTVVAATLSEQIDAFNIHSKKISATMDGIKLEWNGTALLVSSKHWPGKVKAVMPAGIVFLDLAEE